MTRRRSVLADQAPAQRLRAPLYIVRTEDAHRLELPPLRRRRDSVMFGVGLALWLLASAALIALGMGWLTI